MTEKAWMANVVELAKLRGWLVFHTHDSRRSEPGFPDLVLVRDRVVYAELKTETGRVSKEQLTWMWRLRDAQQDVYLWRPGDLPQVNMVLK